MKTLIEQYEIIVRKYVSEFIMRTGLKFEEWSDEIGGNAEFENGSFSYNFYDIKTAIDNGTEFDVSFSA